MKDTSRLNRLMTKRNFCLALLLCLFTASSIYISMHDASAQASKPKTKQATGRSSANAKAKTSRQTKQKQPTKTGEVENPDSFLNWLGQHSLPPKEAASQPDEDSSALAGGEVPNRRKPGSKRADEPDKAMQYHLQKRLPEGETELPLEKYVEAAEQMRQMPVHSTADNRWMSREELRTASPEQPKLGTWSWLGPGNIGGRTRTIVFNPQNPLVMYAGGVSGGVWKSTDGGASWTAVSDLIANIPVSALALEPGNPNVIYAGTGEGFEIGSQNGVNITGGHRGLGIYKSTDGGANWTRLPGTNTANFYYINDLVVSAGGSQRIYAATSTGVWRSMDGGANWTQVHNPNLRGGCLDLAIRTDQMTDAVFASCGTRVQARIFRNTDAGGAGTWTEVLTDTNMGRTVLAIAPSNQNVIYALSTAFTGAFTNSLHAVFRSTTGGESGSWSARVRNTDPNKLNRSILSIPMLVTATDCRIGAADSISGQGFYDLAMAVDPVDENRVWVGGIDVARSDDGGANWGIAGFAYEFIGTALSYGKPNQLHPDQHFLIFHPQYNGATNQQMFVGNDGGIWRTDNARAAVATGPTGACNSANSAVRFTPLNNNYGVTQFYHGAVSPDGKTYLGGTQDNGTPLGNDTDGPNKWKMVVLADGGYAAVDYNTPTTIYASTQQAGFRRSTDGGATFSSATLGLRFDGLLFITPLAMDPSDPLRLHTGGDPVWKTNNGMANWTSLGSLNNVSQTGGVMSAVAISPTDANFVMWGMTDGSIVRTERALSLNANNQLSFANDRARQPRTGFVSWVAFDPTDRNIAYATYSTFGGSHIWKTTNAGDSWTSIDGTGATAFPDIPAHCIIVDPSNTARLYVGTDLGVFVSTDGGASWGVENTGFANVVTESLALNTTGGVTSLYAFTHGRGAFKVTANMTGCNFSLGETGKSVEAGGSDLTVAVNVTPGGCNWRAESNVNWITVQPEIGGSSSGSVRMKVEANINFGTRFGTVNIAGRSFTVTQAGQPDYVSPKILITTPATSVIETNQGTINVSGIVIEDNHIASISYRTNTGDYGQVRLANAISWSANLLPLVLGLNVFTFTATDNSGNSSSATLTVNAKPDSFLLTVAGNGEILFNGDNIQATIATLHSPDKISFDSTGNLYIADYLGDRIRKVAPNGIITTVAGTGVSGFSGDGGPATQARLQRPSHAVVDKNGNLYIADSAGFRVRKVTASTGLISTFAGTGTSGDSGDGGPATAAQLGNVQSLATGKDGNLYIADISNNRVRKVDLATNIITTVAGNGQPGFSGDGGSATSTAVGSPSGLAFDNAGDLYIASSFSNRIRKVSLSTGSITTVAGNGARTFNGDGRTALNTAINLPTSIAFDPSDNLHISEVGNFRIRRVNSSNQVVSTVAGGDFGFSPDGSFAVGSKIDHKGIAFDPAGRLFFADTYNQRVRTIVNAMANDTSAPTVQITSPTNLPMFTATNNPLSLSGSAMDNGTVSLVRWSNDRGGSGQASGSTAWTIPSIPLQRGVNNLTVTAWDSNGNANSAQLAVTYSPAQVMTTIAGTGVIDNTGDGGPGAAATLNQPRGVAVDSKGNVIVADTQNRRVRRISPTGQISAFAGTGLIGSGGDGNLAVDATLNFPNVVITDKADNVYISDQFANRIRKVTPDGKISTIAGTGEGFGGFFGDGGAATQAQLNGQVGLALDNNGNLFIADRLNHRIRRIDAATGVITSVAGTGFAGSAGDGGAATLADLNLPTGVAVDAAGNVYIADTGNQRIRKITAADGRISAIAGNGVAGFSGDGGAASSALINLAYPATLAFDAMGDLYFADRGNQRIRKIAFSMGGTGVITTVVGTGVAGFNGDGTAPAATMLAFPSSVAFDAAGNMLIADSSNNRIRRVRLASALQTVSSVSAASFSTTAGLAAEEIASAFGTNLASATVSAAAIPLPTTLAGTTVKVRDNLGVERLASLFYVSPDQINFQVPSGTATGLATVTVTNSAGEIATGLVAISGVAPSLFAANAAGTGFAAAVVFRRTAAGVDSYEPVVRFDMAANRFVAVPIDLGPEGDQVFLIPYGTGLRGFSGLSGVTATVGGVNAQAIFVGAVPGFIGLDQANLRLDRSLIGKGEVDVALTVDGKAANTLRVAIK